MDAVTLAALCLFVGYIFVLAVSSWHLVKEFL